MLRKMKYVKFFEIFQSADVIQVCCLNVSIQ